MTATFFDFDFTHTEGQAMVAAMSNVSQQAEMRFGETPPWPESDESKNTNFFRKVRENKEGQGHPDDDDSDLPF
jgi:hypothetical protein